MTLPKVVMPLVGENGNAFAILGRFIPAARKAGWPAADIERVVADAKSADYDHLLRVMLAHTEEPTDADES